MLLSPNIQLECKIEQGENMFEITEQEFRDIIQNGAKQEQRRTIAAMVDSYLTDNQGVITRFEKGGLKTFWQMEPGSDTLTEIK
jgi:hypothetical protein